MKVTMKNGTVIEDVSAEELPFVLAMSDPAVVIKKMFEPLTESFNELGTVAAEGFRAAFKGFLK